MSRALVAAGFVPGERAGQVAAALTGVPAPVGAAAGLAAWAAVLGADLDPGRVPVSVAELPAGVLAAAVRAAGDVGVRDAVIAWACPGTMPLGALPGPLRAALSRCLPVAPPWRFRDAAALRRLTGRLAAVCAASPAGHGAGVATLAAAVLWWAGDGTRARVALDRARGEDPGHRLARLLTVMVENGVRATGGRSAGAGAGEPGGGGGRACGADPWGPVAPGEPGGGESDG